MIRVQGPPAIVLWLWALALATPWCWSKRSWLHHPRHPLSSCKDNLRNLASELEMYASEHQGRYPRHLAQLVDVDFRALPTCPASGWASYTLRTGPKDSYRIWCQGHNHPHYGHNQPAYDSIRGIQE